MSGVSQRAIVSLNAPPSPLSSCHCWTVPLPNDGSPTSVARSAVLERPGDDLAGRRAAAVDEDDDLESASVATPSPSASVATWLPFASCSQKTGPDAMNWLAILRAAVT